MRPLLSPPSLLLLAAARAQDAPPVPPQMPTVEWLRAQEGGYFTDAAVFRDGGLYAVRDIPAGATLLQVPPSALLGPLEEDDESVSLECATAWRLFHEYHVLGEEGSRHWPYVSYVFDEFAHETVPLGWSPAGKDLVGALVGRDLQPRPFGSGSYRRSCGFDPEDEEFESLLEAAWRIVMARGWNHVMVPVFDMINHRSGRWLNVDRERNPPDKILEVEGDPYDIVALQDIPAGGQVHNSYSQCLDVTCHGIGLHYVTSHVFNDYGFVEDFPRRFAFDTGYDTDEELGMVLEVDEDEDGELSVAWLTDPNGPNAGQREWIAGQLKRLEEMEGEVRKGADALESRYEGEAAVAYYEAIRGALALADRDGAADAEETGDEL